MYLKALYGTLFIALALTCTTALSQQLTYEVERFSVSDGLPANLVTRALEHSSGFVWVGTIQGLCRFDGYDFEKTNASGRDSILLNGTIYELFEMDNGSLLMSVGLPMRRAGARTYITYDPATCLLEELNDEQYTAKLQSHLISHSDRHNEQTNQGDRTIYIASDNFGNKLIASAFRGIPDSARLILASGQEVQLTEIWSELNLPALASGKNFEDVLYWPHHNGLVKISVSRSPFEVFLQQKEKDWGYGNICRSMLALNNDSILVSTENLGLMVYHRNNRSETPLSWQSSPNAKPSTQYYRYIRPSSEPHVWYGVAGNEVSRFDLSNETREVLATSDANALAATTVGGEYLLICREGRKGIGYTIERVNLSDGETSTLSFGAGQTLLSKSRPTYIVSNTDSTAWLGTQRGLFLLDLKNVSIRHKYVSRKEDISDTEVPTSSSLSGSHIWAIHESVGKHVLIGQNDAGLDVLDVTTGNVESFTENEGLPNNTVVGVLPDSSGYWLSTFNGLSHFDVATRQFYNFYTSHGISHNEFNRYAFSTDQRGKFYFGTMNGVTAFYPQEVLKRSETPRILLCDLVYFPNINSPQVNIRDVSNLPDEIVIPSSHRSLFVKVALDQMKRPEENTFYFRIKNTRDPEQTDQPWQSLGHDRELSFNHLEAGKYTLEVSGISANGVSSDELTMHFRVKEYFYRTWWFFIICFVLFNTILYLLYKARLRQAVKIEQMRTRLSSDLHDEVGGLLSGIAMQMDVLGFTVPDEHQSLVQTVASTSRSAIEKMRDVIWAIDDRQCTLGDLIMRMMESAEEVMTPLDIDYTITTADVSVDTKLPAEVRHNVLFIYKEFVNNSIKHGNISKVEVKFSKEKRNLLLSLRDNGCGFDSALVNGTGQGLKNMRMRVKRMHGTIQFFNEQGLRILISIPISDRP